MHLFGLMSIGDQTFLTRRAHRQSPVGPAWGSLRTSAVASSPLGQYLGSRGKFDKRVPVPTPAALQEASKSPAGNDKGKERRKGEAFVFRRAAQGACPPAHMGSQVDHPLRSCIRCSPVDAALCSSRAACASSSCMTLKSNKTGAQRASSAREMEIEALAV